MIAAHPIQAHELVALDAVGTLCSCGTRSPHHLEHLGMVALVTLGAPLQSNDQRDDAKRERDRVRGRERLRERRAAAEAQEAADRQRTAGVLADLQAEQERLGAALAATGLTGFADRADWLINHRGTPRRWGRNDERIMA